MNIANDETGGAYGAGLYEWPGGVPIVSAKDVIENHKMVPVLAAVREEVKNTVIYLMINEAQIFNFCDVEIIASEMAS